LNLFVFSYYTLVTIIYILFSPLLILFSFKQKYQHSLPKRFFLWKNNFFKKEGLWFHACSLGEVAALKPFIEKYKKQYTINISTTTHTGLAQAKKMVSSYRYLPYELFIPFWIKKQKILIIIEAEFWFMVIYMAKLQGTKVILLNSRISDRSYSKYLKLKWFYAKIFSYVDEIYAQTEVDKNRLESLGANNIKVIGNIKLAQLPVISKNYKKDTKDTILVGASTHENEEKLILEAYFQSNITRLILVPRHPERFDIIYALMSEYATKYGVSLSRFSQNINLDTNLVLIDTLGELINIYNIADIVILGGSFEQIGGHNPIEPAYFKTKIISGKYIFNQNELYGCVDNIVIVEENELATHLQEYKKIKPSVINQKSDLSLFYSSIENNKT